MMGRAMTRRAVVDMHQTSAVMGPSRRHMACGGIDLAETHICVPSKIRFID